MSHMKELKTRIEESHQASECVEDWQLSELALISAHDKTEAALVKCHWLRGKKTPQGIAVSIQDLERHLEKMQEAIREDLRHIMGVELPPTENPSGHPSCNPTAGRS